MRLTQTLKQKPTVSPQLVLANELLQFSSLELEQAIAQELAENPALELQQIGRCPRCGTELAEGRCEVCESVEPRFDDVWSTASDTPDWDAEASARYPPSGDGYDPVSRLPSCTSLSDYLLQQARLSLSTEDVAVARHLIGSLDDRGLLSQGLDEIVADLGLERDRVEDVLSVLQSLEPVGIAARDVRECLLIQLAQLREDGGERSVAERLILEQWDRLGRSSLANLGKSVDASVNEVREALQLVREHCNPFPARTCWALARRVGAETSNVCPEPDVVIRESEGASGAYEIELPKAGDHRLRVNDCYSRALRGLPQDNGAGDREAWDRWQELCGRARLFVRSIEQRWETLHKLMRCLVDYQRGFLAHGRAALKPLTRAEVADIMGVHESTVSRAVAGKYAQLPSGEVVPLEVFFDSAAPIKCLIKELVAEEETALSDRAIAERLSEEGYDVARRTVAKYRNALNILPASLRKRERELEASG